MIWTTESRLERTLTWIIEEFDRVIYKRKEDIRSKKPGALTGPGEPRLIFLSIPERPRNTTPKKHEVFRLVSKTNNVLENIIKRHGRYCHLLYIESINEFLHFDYHGRYTPQGKIQLWKEIDEKVKLFDKGQIDLNPREFKPTIPRRSITLNFKN